MGGPDNSDTGKKKGYIYALDLADKLNIPILQKDVGFGIIAHADLFIELLSGKEEALRVVHETGRDPFPVTERIRSILKEMHLNGQNNHYTTLLLSPNTSRSDISRRFKALMRLYHPDLHGNACANDADCARRISDAYSILKDPVKRAGYDKELVWKVFSLSRPGRPSRRGLRKRRTFLKVILPGTVVLVCLFVAFSLIVEQKESRHVLESLPHAKNNIIGFTEQVDPGMAANADTSLKAANSEWRDMTTPVKNIEISEKEVLPKEGEYHHVVAALESLRTLATRRSDPVAKSAEEKKILEKTERPVEPMTHTDPVIPERTSKPGRVVEAVKVASTTHTFDHKADVNTFINQYTLAYEEGDINRFIQFYSPSVIENNKMDYGAIKVAYRKNFETNKYKYSFKNMKLKDEGDQLLVSGSYSITKLKENNPGIIKGDITWRLKREDGGLKIIKVDYNRL